MRYAIMLLAATAVPPVAKAADRLPLAHGIFVATDTACKGALQCGYHGVLGREQRPEHFSGWPVQSST